MYTHSYVYACLYIHTFNTHRSVPMSTCLYKCLYIYTKLHQIFTACTCTEKDEESCARMQRGPASLVPACLLTDLACPRRHGIHKILGLLWALHSTTRAWRILAAQTAVLFSVLERLNYFVLVREGLVRSSAAGRARWSLADFAFQNLLAVLISPACE